MSDLLKIRDEIILRNSASVQQIEPKTFSQILVEYFMQFWEAHSLPKGWLTMDTSQWATESLPMFHGMFISASEDLLKDAERHIRQIMPMGFHWGRADNIYNRAGEFTFLNINKDITLERLLNGRLYDIYILMEDIEPTEEMIKILTRHTKDGQRGRIITLRQGFGLKRLTAKS